MKKKSIIILALCCLTLTNWVSAQDKPAGGSDAAELAKKLSNPVASLISLPFQNNTDVGIGPYKGWKNTLNIQPVIPIKLTAKVNLIARVILPVVAQENVVKDSSNQFGLSDAVVSAFISPAEAKKGFVWGAGPVFLVPTATDKLLGTQKFGLGPTILLLEQTHGFTMGLLANQIWSVAGNKDRGDVNMMFLQPFFSYSFKSGAGLGLNSEITQNWQANNTLVYLNASFSGITRWGGQIVSLSIGPRFLVASPESGKMDFGIRGSLTLVFPKKG